MALWTAAPDGLLLLMKFETPPVDVQLASVWRQTVSVALASVGSVTVVALACPVEACKLKDPEAWEEDKLKVPVALPTVPTVTVPPTVALLVTDKAVPAAVKALPATLKVLAWFW